MVDHSLLRRFLEFSLIVITLNIIMFSSSGFMDSHPAGNRLIEDRLSSIDFEVLNIDGDLALPSIDDRLYWSSHSVGFTDLTFWNVSFGDDVLIVVETGLGEVGHVAVGFWPSSFRGGDKIPLLNYSSIFVDFDVSVEYVRFNGFDFWFRIALAAAVQRFDGSVVYTELDFWDSPNTQRGLIGDILYRGGDVVEFKVDQVPLGVWRHFRINLTGYIERAWGIAQGDRLESIYIVVESAWNSVKAIVRVDNLWISRPVE